MLLIKYWEYLGADKQKEMYLNTDNVAFIGVGDCIYNDTEKDIEYSTIATFGYNIIVSESTAFEVMAAMDGPDTESMTATLIETDDDIKTELECINDNLEELIKLSKKASDNNIATQAITAMKEVCVKVGK